MQRKGAFDYILLETTGLADPGMSSSMISTLSLNTVIKRHTKTVWQGPIASIFWRNEEFNRGRGKDIVLDGVVCVVDAVFGKQVSCIPCQMTYIHVLDGASKWR
jgi:G3E family GTPase